MRSGLRQILSPPPGAASVRPKSERFWRALTPKNGREVRHTDVTDGSLELRMNADPALRPMDTASALSSSSNAPEPMTGDPRHFINRELSTLAFLERLLEEAS